MTTINDGNFCTISGDYYVKMERDGAKDKKKFDAIDLNGDGKLQGHEIVAERRRETAEKKGNLLATASAGASFSAGGLLIGSIIYDKAVSIMENINTYCLNDSKGIAKKIIEYEKWDTATFTKKSKAVSIAALLIGLGVSIGAGIWNYCRTEKNAKITDQYEQEHKMDENW